MGSQKTSLGGNAHISWEKIQATIWDRIGYKVIGPITSIFWGWCGTWKLCVSMFKHFKRQITMITQIRMICPSNNHDVYRLVVSQIRNHPTCWFIIGRTVCSSLLGWFPKGPAWLMTRMVYSVLYQVLKPYHIIYHFISLIFQMCPNHWSF